MDMSPSVLEPTIGFNSTFVHSSGREAGGAAAGRVAREDRIEWI